MAEFPRDKQHKLNKLKELHSVENDINKRINDINKIIGQLHFEEKKLGFEKIKLAKRVSHNMKLRHIIINEIEALYKK